MPSPGKGKRQIRHGKKGARKEKKATQAKVTVKRQQSPRASRVSVETAECTSKGKGTGKSKSKVTEINDSDSSKQVEETWTPNTSAPPSSMSQVNTIGCADEGLWKISLEDSKKRQHTVNWEDQSDCKTEWHELMVGSACFGHVCPPWFAPHLCRHVHLTRHFLMQLHNSFHAYHIAWLKTSHPTCL